MNSNVNYKGKVTINTPNKKIVCYNKGTMELFTSICNLLIGKTDTGIPTYIDLLSGKIQVESSSIQYEPNNSLLLNPLVITYKKIKDDSKDTVQLSALLIKSNIRYNTSSEAYAALLDNTKKILAVISVDTTNLAELEATDQASIDWELTFGNAEGENK